MLRIVVLCLRVLIHIESGVTPRTVPEVHIVRIRQSLQIEDGQALAVVEPVQAHRELFIDHPVPGQRHLDGLRLRILQEVAFPSQFVHVQNTVRSANRVQDGPAREILDRVVRTVVAAPSGHALQITPRIEIPIEKRLARPRLRPDQLSFEQRPFRRRRGRLDRNGQRIGIHL